MFQKKRLKKNVADDEMIQPCTNVQSFSKNNCPHNEIQVIYLIQLHLENLCLSLFFLV